MIKKCKVRKFIFREVSCFQSATLLKNEPLHRIISKFLPRFLVAAFKLWYIMNSFNRYFQFGAASRNYGKILKNQSRRSLFLNLKFNASNCHLLKMDSIRGFSRILSKFHTICCDLLEFSERLFQRTPPDGCFYTSWKYWFFGTIFYLKKSYKSVTPWIILQPSAKNSNFSGFYCVSIAVTNIIFCVV